MSKDEIFELIKTTIVEIVPEISIDQINAEHSMKAIITNSIDRMDIIITVMEKLGVKIPLVEFGSLENIQGMVNLFHDKQ